MPTPRRSFLGAATALSYARILGANDRLRAGGIGLGGRCRYLLSMAKQYAGAEIVALSDVYGPRRDEARKIAPEAREYADYRQLLESKDIDAVFIGSPDHWHVPMTIDAVNAGKDVYVEKPLTKSIAEGPRVIAAVAASRRIVQVGYQQRSWAHFAAARRLFEEGVLGKVTLVLASWYQNYATRNPATMRVEADKLDWRRWLGSAPNQPVDARRYFTWRWFWDFGGGHLTDLFSHYGDVIHWYMNADTPRSVSANGGVYALDWLECPDSITAAYDYPGFALTYTGALVCSLEGGNIIFRGSKAMLKINRDGFAVYPEGAVPAERTHYPEPLATMRSERDGTIDHILNFAASVRSRQAPNSTVETAVAAARAAHWGNQAYREGRKLQTI